MSHRIRNGALAALFALPGCACAADWPIHFDTANGTRIAATGNFAFDAMRFDHEAPGLEDDHGWRRRELGVSAKRKDYFEVAVQYDFEARAWLDTAVRLHSKGLLGRNVGSLRMGWFKTPVGLDALGASRTQAFIEAPLATQAIHAGRRSGVEWSISRPHGLASLAWMGGNDPEGNDPGTTLAMRGAFTPRQAKGDVLHLGLSATRERPTAEVFRLRARPEVGFTPTRLVDTGPLGNVQRIDRAALELIRVRGPWTLQGEWLQARVARRGQPSMRAHGGHAWLGWMATGESRPYNGGLVGNPVPAGKRPALELLARVSHLDLDDGAVRGGVESAVTAGANLYIGEHWKLQLNHVWTDADRRGQTRNADSLQFRAQMHF